MKIELSISFKKSFKKLAVKRPDIAILALEKILLFSQDPYNSTLRLHKLKGKLQHFWSFSIESDIRIIIDFKEPFVAVLILIGNHDEVYK